MTKVHLSQVFLPYGMRREDGQPWKSKPEFEGDLSYYVLGSELTEDGMVFPFFNTHDLIYGVLIQNDPDAADNPHPGRVVPMESVWENQELVYRDMSWGMFEVYARRELLGPPEWLRDLVDREVWK